MGRFAWVLYGALLWGCVFDAPVQPTKAPDELGYNYWLLQHLYIYPEQLESPDVYYNIADSLLELGAKPPATLTGISTRQYFSVKALYWKVKDPFTRYIAPEKVEEQKQHDTSTVIQGGLGIEMLWAPGPDSARVEVSRVYEDSPADSAGLQKGDRLIRVNGFDMRTDTALITFQNVMKDSLWIRFDALRTQGDSTDSVHVDILRGTVFVPTVFADTINGIPVIELTKFMRTSIRDGGSVLEFHRALEATRGKGVRVLDLRGNPGGEINVCLQMADEFLGKVPMVHLINRRFSGRGVAEIDTITYLGQAGGVAINDRVILAVDSSTASCAEIFAGALKDNLGDQVTIVGTHTYGKAIGQSHWDTPAKGLAIITSLEIRTPKWLNYHTQGIPADEITEYDQILSSAITRAQEMNGLARKQLLITNQKRIRPDFPNKNELGGAWIESSEINP